MIFFTSDTHFGSKRTLKLSRRPFSSVSEMNMTLVENWNRVVGKDDLVYHLGDFGSLNTIKKLNGKVILSLGNYEKDLRNVITGRHLEEIGFYSVVGSQIVNIDGKTFFLCHKPSQYNPRYFNLFGHIHKLQMVKRFGLNVGTDCHNFAPISLDDVLFYKEAIESYYDENVFMQGECITCLRKKGG